MSLMPPKVIGLSVVIALAVALVSCNQQMSTPTAPTAPNALGAPATMQPSTREFVDNLVGVDSAQPLSGVLALEAPTPSAPPPPGSGPVPWPPGPPPLAAPGFPVPTLPSIHFRLHVKIDPEPVPHSGVPVPLYACRDNPHAWYYDQHIVTDTGVPVIFTERENFFDGYFVSRSTQTIRVEGNSEVVLHTRWCSAYPKPRYTQTRFKGKDEYGEDIVFSGPWVRLLTPL